VVRDHVLHDELMIGCMWAGRTDCGIDFGAGHQNIDAVLAEIDRLGIPRLL
jgi:hypothetical protein